MEVTMDRRLTSSRSLAVDVFVAFLLVMVFWVPEWGPEPLRVATGLALAGVVGACMVARWRWPRASTVAAVVATAVALGLGLTTDPFLGSAWCLYTVALRRPRPPRLLTLAGLGLVVLLAISVGIPADAQGVAQTSVLALGAAAASWLLGRSEGQLLEAARVAALAQADRERIEHQLALSRDLHDGVGHSLSLIGAEADVAQLLPATDGAELRASLASIERTAREALRDVQDVVRRMQGNDPVRRLDRAAAALPQMLAAAQGCGLEVVSRIELPPQLPPEVDEVVVRVVQESLSNVLRHARASRVQVSVWLQQRGLRVTIDDDGIGLRSLSGEGTGLRSMRDRLRAVDGQLVTSSQSEGGTRVDVMIPLEITA